MPLRAPTMTPEQAIAEARSEKLRPVYLVLGEERLFVDRVVTALREATQKGGIAGFNEDKFTAGEQSASAVVGAAKMVPMMAKRRFVLVRGLDRWEKKADEDGADEAPAKGKKGKVEILPLDELAEYAKEPADTAVVVMVSPKLHGQRRLVTLAKKAGFIVNCDALSRRDLPGWIEQVARDKGHAIAPDIADHLAEIAGPELGYVADAIERLSLYVGPKQPITEDAVAAIVTRVRQSSVWELIDALGKRRLADAMKTLADVYDPRDGGLRMLGAVAWSVRQMVKFESALRASNDPREAAARAGVAPFKAQEMAQTVKAIPAAALARWMRLLAHADLALKSSKRSPQAILEAMIIEMCA
jgi:DNA polymerase III subunit delta